MSLAATDVIRIGHAAVDRDFHVDGVRAGDLLPHVRRNVSKSAKLMTDEANTYNVIAEIESLEHDTVNHSKEEYVRYEGDEVISTSTVEGY